MKWFFGVDLGTTNSVISYVKIDDGGEKHVPVALQVEQYNPRAFSPPRTTTLPSYVYYPADRVIVGDYARSQYSLQPDLVAKSIKSQMGAPKVTKLAASVPDQTPEEVSARILEHLRIFGGEKNQVIRHRVTEAVIAVPANFDTAARTATLKAAELAGFSMRETDGSWKQVLISEPNAVLYDVAQRYLDTGIQDEGIDFSKPQNVIVFDMGGGTLDITFQEVTPSYGKGGLDISEIASARYTRLAGDLFDLRGAEMLHARYVKKMEEISNSYNRDLAVANRASMLNRLLPAAEQMKIDCSRLAARNPEEELPSSFWDFQEMSNTADINVDAGSGMHVTDHISPEEYYELIRPLLGEDLTFSDYENYQPSGDLPENIIVPLLDVLAKAASYYRQKGEALQLDAVILNGGMCKLHWIRERLERFFGFAPVMTRDPATSVANGAAVYASLLQRMQEEAAEEGREHFARSDHAPEIRIIRRIQNETLYLGLSAGAKVKLISEQQKLPYTKEFTGLGAFSDSQWLQLPVLRQTDWNSFEAIARCAVNLGKKFGKKRNVRPLPLSLSVSFDLNGLLTVDTILEIDGSTLRKRAEFELRGEDRRGAKILPCRGSILAPSNELYALEDNSSKRNMTNIRMEVIKDCGNPEDFEAPILDALEKRKYKQDIFFMDLVLCAQNLCGSWSAAGREALCAVAREALDYHNTRSRDSRLRPALQELLRQLNG